MFFKLGKQTAPKKRFDEHFLLDPSNEEFVANPYPMLSHIRSLDSLSRSRSGAYILSRYQDVSEALANPDLGNAPAAHSVLNRKNEIKYTCAQVANNILPFQDGQKHTDKRFFIARSFFKQLKKTNLDLEGIANEVLEPLLQQKTFDVIHDYGTRFSGLVMVKLMGLPEKDIDKLSQWSEWFLFLFTGIPDEAKRIKIDSSLKEFRQYFQAIIASKKTSPKNDWISSLLFENSQDKCSLSDQELIDNLMLIFADGIENVDRVLGSCVKLLIEHPQQFQKFKNNSLMAEQVIDECLRFESPVQIIARIALCETVINDTKIKEQSVIFLMLGAANRDDKQFKSADKFSIIEKHHGILSFGKGHHACLGKTLVKQQLIAALKAIVIKCPNMSLANKPQWEPRFGHRWLTSCALKTNKSKFFKYLLKT